MTDPRLHAQLSQLIRNCERAHRAAFASTGGEDPEWPLWYTEYLRQPLEQALDTGFHKCQLIYGLMNADFEHTARAPDTEWAEFLAAELIEHYAPSTTATTDRLSLYTAGGCPFCWSVIGVIERLGLEVGMCDIYANRLQRDELLEARGRTTVPVLKIESPDGTVRWMPESADNIHYLEHTYGAEA